MPEITWPQILLMFWASFVLLGVVALLRCRREDIVEVVRELRRTIRK
ncbi:MULTISPECIES: hypothetical protein [unclassified Streptomyces]|nr:MULTISPECIES: hypothetical protein [unclassified Streptomyces]